MDTDAILRLMRQELEPSVVSLDQDYTFYHWTSAQVSSDILRSEYIHLRVKESKAIESVKTGNKLGVGFYLAPNPIVSSRFGVNLIALNLLQGTRLLEIFPDSRTIGLSNRLQQQLMDYCELSSLDFSQGRVRIVTLRKNERCNTLWNQAMKGLGVDGILYSFGTDGENRFCPSRLHRHAIMLYESDRISGHSFQGGINPEAVQFHTRKLFRCVDF